MRCIAVAVVFTGLGVVAAAAAERLQVTAVPIPWHVQGEPADVPPQPGPPAGTFAVGDSLVYSCTNYSAGYFFSPGAGVMFADDVHLTTPVV